MLTVCDSCRALDDLTEARRRIAEVTVRILSGADVCSGVIVSPSGHILTVAHGVHPEAGPVRVVSGTGDPHEATVLIHDQTADVALLQCSKAEGDRPLEYLPMELKQPLQSNQLVLACGYPARDRSLREGILRTGSILLADEQNVRTTCMLTVGDSGGPLVNADGRLIGLHRQIGVGPHANLHIPVTKAVQAIRTALPDTELAKLAALSKQTRLLPDHLSLADELHQKVMNRTVRLSQDDTGKTVVHGFMMSHSLVVTKLSELDPTKPIRVHRVGVGGSDIQNAVLATVLRRDRTIDMAVLRLDEELAIDESSLPLSVESGVVGDLVFAFSSTTHRAITNGSEKLVPLNSSKAQPKPLQVIAGIIGRAAFDEPSAKPRLGIVLDEKHKTGSMAVENVLPSSAASEAGITVGDVLLQADDQLLDSPAALGLILKSWQPGDRMTLQIRVAANGAPDRTLTRNVQLKGDPSNQFEKTEFLDGRAGAVSSRRTGFQQVMQIDAAVEPEDCGTVVVSPDGELIGLVIARRSRESTLVLPMATVSESVAKAETSADHPMTAPSLGTPQE
ncbi:MAG: trypsin-like peptidase domain-containing protein [Planctomycetaceae bacterium]|nr:trypsin-like peptidase domain-containing protein [Planctomycetaceae bacterium]